MRPLLLAVGLLVAACSIPTEQYTQFVVPCGSKMCGDNSTCVEAGSAATCVCNVGFQDNDHDGTCTATCDDMMCASKMSCDDSSGTATCVCNAGFQDNDHDGSCTLACSLTDCGTGSTCSDATGTAVCGCALGYQDKDGDKVCSPSCDNVTCGNKGCDDSSGVAVCVCGPGLQDNDNNNTCTPDCSQVTCGTNATCSDATGTATCNCTGSYVDFDADGNCTSLCGVNLLNSSLTGGAASVASITSLGGYSNRSYLGSSCSGHPDTAGILCDNAPSAGSPKAFEDTYPRAGARFYTNFSGGTGVVVIDAGSAITFNTLEMYQHFRPYGGLAYSRADTLRFSIHASTTTAPAANDAGWVPLSASFISMPSAQKNGNSIVNPAVWFGANQTSRFIRVEVKGNNYRAGYRAVKGFLCQ